MAKLLMKNQYINDSSMPCYFMTGPQKYFLDKMSISKYPGIFYEEKVMQESSV